MGRLAPHVLDDRIVLLRMKLGVHEVVHGSPSAKGDNQNTNPDQTAET